MLNHYFLENWILKQANLNGKSLTDAQAGQAYARLAFACASIVYLMLHASNFTSYQTAFETIAAIYFLVNLIAIPMIRRFPISSYSCLLSPILDIFVVSFGMLIDGGQSSGIFFIFLVIILGNGFRFGNSFLLYTQSLSLIGFLCMIAYAYFDLQLDIDQSLLLWQLGALLAIPLYVYLIGQRTEEAVKGRIEAEKTAYNLLDKGPLPIFTFDLDDHHCPRILYTNSMVHQVFQHPKGDLIGASPEALILPEDSAEMIAFCRSTLDQDVHQHTTQNMYIRSTDKSGQMIKLLCTSICMHWHGNMIGVCFMLDISDREAMQEELESVHRKGYMSTLVAGIVHDFRNVLTNMIGYAEVLQMGTQDQTALHQLDAIIAAGDRGSDLITHLLKLSKNSESDGLPAHTNRKMIIKPLENIMGLARLQMPQHIQLICDFHQPESDVAISMIEIEQIIMNLLNNAMQAMKEAGTIRIYLGNNPSHRLSKPNHPCMSIKVTDSGSGIAAKDIDNVFKAFWTSRASQGGTGLGLTLVQRIVKRHQGVIAVSSIPNQETCFSIHLPPYITPEEANETEDLPPPSPIATATPGYTDIPRCHVLLVDDVPDILQIHRAMLARLQHTSTIAENGKEALNIFTQKDHHFDLIITDYRMPVMDGLELVRNIRELGSPIPILMITAFGEDSQLQQMSNYDVTLINKPVSLERFKSAISKSMST